MLLHLGLVGDGSGLTGVSGASGSGLAIRDSGSTVGTAGTINFRNNLTVSSFTGGTATVDATAPDPTNLIFKLYILLPPMVFPHIVLLKMEW